MTLHPLHFAAVTALSLSLVAASGCAAKTSQADTRPMAPGAEQGGAGSDGTNSVTDAKAEEGAPADAAGSDTAADTGSEAGTGSTPGGAGGTTSTGGGVASPPR